MKPRLVVVGDLLLDRDWSGVARRLSPDGPAPVIEQVEEVVRPGGAGMTAVAAGALAGVVLVTAVGTGPGAAEVGRLLAASGVEVIDLGADGPTPEKIRVRAGDQTVARLDQHPDTRPTARSDDTTLRRVAGALREADAVVVADYGRGVSGMLPVRRLLADASSRVPLVWDPHPLGPVPLLGTDLATPNVEESYLAIKRASAGGALADERPRGLARIVELAEALRTAWSCPVAVTVGELGAVLADGRSAPQLVPTEAVRGDACGAGDHLAASYAAGRARGDSRVDALRAGVRAASAHVARHGVAGSAAGAAPLPLRPSSGIAVAEEVRRRGGLAVATSGCFDLLHSGHVQLLEQARSLGDCLIVCLNDDRSVRRLKGPGRPVNGVADRAAVLRSLRCVDAVEVFSEETPAALLGQLQPSLFVKGGDYEGVELPERAAMATWGGQVVLLPTLPGRSTSHVLARAVTSAAIA